MELGKVLELDVEVGIDLCCLSTMDRGYWTEDTTNLRYPRSRTRLFTVECQSSLLAFRFSAHVIVFMVTVSTNRKNALVEGESMQIAVQGHSRWPIFTPL